MEVVSSLALAIEEFRIGAHLFDSMYYTAESKCKNRGIEIPLPHKRIISVKLDSQCRNLRVDTNKKEVILLVFYCVLDASIVE